MKILLIGEYSNVHWTLAEGLRALGHEVCVVSNGDFWKDYRRDISLTRRNDSRLSGIKYLLKAYLQLPKFKHYDIVQVINPMFLELKAERIFPYYRFLRKNNKKLFMGAFGMDAYWVKYASTRPYKLRYSDFNIADKAIDNDYTRAQIADWQKTQKALLNETIARECNGIIAGMYEYYASYQEEFGNKLIYIPFPVDTPKESTPTYSKERKLRFFIGIQRSRSIYKGTDIMLRALERVVKEYPDYCEMYKAENIPFKQYSQMITDCDILLDQLYGYSPGMNALLALANGKIVVGGAEEEHYDILNEKQLRPMVNVIPNEQDVYEKLKSLVLQREKTAKLQAESIEYVQRHHSPVKVAQQYLDFWNNM